MGFAQNKHGPCNCDGFGTIIVTNFSVATDVYIMLHQHVSTECHYVWWSSPWLFTLFWGNGGSTDQMFDFIWHKGDPLIQWFQWFQWTFCGFFELHFFLLGFLTQRFRTATQSQKADSQVLVLHLLLSNGLAPGGRRSSGEVKTAQISPMVAVMYERESRSYKMLQHLVAFFSTSYNFLIASYNHTIQRYLFCIPGVIFEKPTFTGHIVRGGALVMRSWCISYPWICQ